MQSVLYSAAVALITLLIAFLFAKQIIKAYFAAKREFVNQMIDRAKELASGKKQG